MCTFHQCHRDWFVSLLWTSIVNNRDHVTPLASLRLGQRRPSASLAVFWPLTEGHLLESEGERISATIRIPQGKKWVVVFVSYIHESWPRLVCCCFVIPRWTARFLRTGLPGPRPALRPVACRPSRSRALSVRGRANELLLLLLLLVLGI